MSDYYGTHEESISEMRPNLIAVYRILPTEPFRVNSEPIIHLRDMAHVQARPGQCAINGIASHDKRVVRNRWVLCNIGVR